MKKLLLFFFLLTISIGQSQNLLTNGNFTGGTASWTGNNFSVVSGEALISSTASGGNPWDTQLVQAGMSFTAGARYTVTFRARAAANRNITVAIQNVGTWEDQFRQTFALTTTMQTYTATFNAPFTNGNVQIGFLMGALGSTAAVNYDDVSIAQNLITNGNFSNGTANWVFTPTGSVTGGEAFFSSANAGGNPWDTELKQLALSFTNATTYTLTFRARAAANRNISVNIQNTGIWNDQFRDNAVALTTTTTTYSYTFNATSTNTNAQLNFHMANMGVNTTAAVYIDEVSIVRVVTTTCANGIQDGGETGVDCGGTCPTVCPPPAAPIPPTRNSWDVVSLYSGSYTSTAGAVWQHGTDVPLLPGNNNARYFNGFTLARLAFAARSIVTMTTLHIDVYTLNQSQLWFEINSKRKAVSSVPLNGWVSFDIPLTDFVALDLANVSFFDLNNPNGAEAPARLVYLDNIYFYRAPTDTPPTIGALTVPSPKVLGDAPFTLTNPTSNSGGAWSYSASPAGIVTFSGNTVTIIGGGTTTITATQAAVPGSFGPGIATASLVVNYPDPGPSPIPPVRDPARVISMYTGTPAFYTNAPNYNLGQAFWSTGGGRVLTEIPNGTNTALRIDGLGFMGLIDIGNPPPVNRERRLNLVGTGMSHLNIDIYLDTPKPNLFLVLLAPSDRLYNTGPLAAGWNRLRVPLTAYPGALNDIYGLKIEQNYTSSFRLFVDNIYFSNDLYTFYRDLDGDTYGNAASTILAETAPTGYVSNNTDCNDGDENVWRTGNFYLDFDSDGYNLDYPIQTVCYGIAPEYYFISTSLGVDCDDSQADRHESFPFFVDGDGDGYGAGNAIQLCAVDGNTPPEANYSVNDTDCDDTQADRHQTYPFFVDGDGDGYGAGNAVQLCAVDGNTPPEANYSVNDTDCDDTQADRHESFPFFVDGDGDGYGVGTAVQLCAVDGNTPPEANYSVNDTDCDDTQADRHETFPFFVDADGDGYGVGTAVQLCAVDGNTPPEDNYSVNDDDCNDAVFAINPGVVDTPYDSIDNNCDGSLFDGHAPVVVNLLSPSCGGINHGLNNTINCTEIYLGEGYVIGYRFKVTNLVTGEVAYVDTILNKFKLSDTDIYAYGTPYSIQVAAIVNGEVQPYNGLICTLTTTSVATTKVIATQCGSTLLFMNTTINASAVNQAITYRFRVARADAPGVYYLSTERTAPNFNLTMLSVPNGFLTYGTEYKVDVQIKIKLANFVAWSQYGEACSIFTPPMPDTSLVASQCDLTATSDTQVINATPFAGATLYRFRLTSYNLIGDLVYSQYVDTPNPYFTLSMFTGLLPDTTYTVSVSMQLYGTFVNYGKDCSVTTPLMAKTTMMLPFKVVAYPNPFAENFMIDITTSNQEMVNLTIYDMLGRLIEKKEVNTTDMKNSPFGDQYPSGVYNIIVTQGKEVSTVRVVKR